MHVVFKVVGCNPASRVKLLLPFKVQGRQQCDHQNHVAKGSEEGDTFIYLGVQEIAGGVGNPT